jgi:Phytanoyl-CoA dioxygenase (PhyH)
MSKDVDQKAVCDWHVDDVGFWPESYISEQHEGINVWIALEDMPAQFQGSMALAPGSHKADWRYDAYHAIGQNRSYHGGFTKKEMMQRAQAGEKLFTTCEMRQQAPDISRMIDETAFIPDIKKGDIIFATRTLFHRTLAVTSAGVKHYSERGIEHLNRYSIRYVPSTARLPRGWAFEWGILANERNAGKSLDEAMEGDSLLWYPQVWPVSNEDINPHLDTIAMTTFDDIKEKTRAEVVEFISLFSGNH